VWLIFGRLEEPEPDPAAFCSCSVEILHPRIMVTPDPGAEEGWDGRGAAHNDLVLSLTPGSSLESSPE